MQILTSSLENGMISARLLIEYSDILMAAGQQAAVQQAIVELSESLGVSDVHYASVNEMTETDMGDIEIAVEAAVSPEVRLGQYRDSRSKSATMRTLRKPPSVPLLTTSAWTSLSLYLTGSSTAL